MNYTEYETVREAAERLGVTARAIQKQAADGKIHGAVKHGKSWMIPKNAAMQAKSERTGNEFVSQYTPMPVMAGDYRPGSASEYIDAISDCDCRDIARGEICFYRGQSAEAARIMVKYQDSRDPVLRFSSNLVAIFSNLSGGYTDLVWLAIHNLRKQLNDILKTDSPPEQRALGVFVATMASVLFHISFPDIPPLKEYMRYLPEGLKVYSCYILAHKAYLEKDHHGALAIADIGTSFTGRAFPVGFIYCHIIAAIALVNLKRTKEALERFEKAWELAEPDGLIQPFGEHHGLLNGLSEIFFKDKDPKLRKQIEIITYNFSAGWRSIHKRFVKRDVADNLSTYEFTIAMLFSRGWSADEIGKHLGISRRTVYNHISVVYDKLGVFDKKQLGKFMLY